MNELAERDRREYQHVKPWRIDLNTVNTRSRDDEVIRRATRSIEYHYRAYPKLSSGVAAVWLFVVVASLVGLGYLFFG